MDEIHQTLSEIYPEVDIDQLFIDQPDKSLAWYADHIVNNLDTVRKRVVQRVPSATPSESDDGPSVPLIDHVKLKSELIAELSEIARKDLAAPLRNKRSNPRFASVFRRIFIQLSKQCQDNILKVTGGRKASSFIIAFFVKNGLLENIIDFIPLPLAGFWTATDLDFDDAVLEELPALCRSYKATKEICYLFVDRYSAIVDANTLCINMPVLTGETFNCGVCYDDASIDAAIACGTEDPFDDDVIIISSDPCSSTDIRPRPVQHKFCTDCVRRHAAAATESMPISDCGTGLKCMEHGCKRPLLFSRVRHVLPKKTISMLENRVLAENLAAFGDIEKCPKCNFAVAMEVSKEEDKVFRCFKCKSNWCRLCELPWNDDHFGRSCDETALKSGVDKKKRDLERKANEAVMRKCHKCNLPFTKDEGCNKVTCRCGATQCYICRTKSIDYSHFCRHPTLPNQARTCCNKCLLWDDANSVDRQAIVRVYEEAGEAPPEDTGPPPKRFRFGAFPQVPVPEANFYIPPMVPLDREAIERAERRMAERIAQAQARRRMQQQEAPAERHVREHDHLQQQARLQELRDMQGPPPPAPRHDFGPAPVQPPINRMDPRQQAQIQQQQIQQQREQVQRQLLPLPPLPQPPPPPPMPNPNAYRVHDLNFQDLPMNEDPPQYQLPPLPRWPLPPPPPPPPGPAPGPQQPQQQNVAAVPPQNANQRALKRRPLRQPPNPPAARDNGFQFLNPDNHQGFAFPPYMPLQRHDQNGMFQFGQGGFNNGP
uniref:RING-type domain-containing protein n=1 Tax=Panagrellus redivivus TaxID=6233 RepID=A0A7E4VQT2_PANRE